MKFKGVVHCMVGRTNISYSFQSIYRWTRLFQNLVLLSIVSVSAFSDSKMFFFISFLIGIQIVHILAASTAPSFVYPSCNSLVVKAAAEAALNKINSNRKQGYVLGLQRIFDVHELPQVRSSPSADFFFFPSIQHQPFCCQILGAHIYVGRKKNLSKSLDSTQEI